MQRTSSDLRLNPHLHVVALDGAWHEQGSAVSGQTPPGTIAVDMDPLSLLCRLATSVPPPRLHTVRYAGVLAAASPWRPKPMRSRP